MPPPQMPQARPDRHRAGGAAVPLARYRLFRSRDLDEARERVAAVFCPHRLDSLAARRRFDAAQHHLPGQGLSLNYIDYGARMLIEPGELGAFYLLQIPLEGGAHIVQGTEGYDSTPTHAALLNPHRHTRMTWAEGTRQVLVRIDRAVLQAQAVAMLGLPEGRPVTFRGGIDLRAGPGAALQRFVLWLVAEADAGRAPIGQGLMARAVEEALMAGVLEAALPERDGAAAAVAPARPRHLRRAEAYIAAHLDRPLTLGEVAQAAGASPRALQAAFRAHRGTTPLGFWRDLRLDGARADLQAGVPGTTVTDVALNWGFQHFGRFADAYRGRFGELPSETLRLTH
ncbi:MAG: AraC family transcriptional regulator [Pararhodobacter sp.]